MKRPGIGHNGGPKSEPSGLRAAWLRFADQVELRRLAKLHMRIERRELTMKDSVGERQKIMNRYIKRIRRAHRESSRGSIVVSEPPVHKFAIRTLSAVSIEIYAL
ncbi:MULTISPECIES: hypothetical protein [Alphaproteobacteria]|uniref:hypothetical protein n=1 Tax=Alphaproteobacteria TaxID=28211 RepID=UPI003263F368